MKRFTVLVVLVTVLVVALGGSGSRLLAQDSTPAATMAGTEAANPLLAQLPASLQALYVNATSPMLPSAYDNFKAVPGPWKICHSESYQGNPWRVSFTHALKRLAAEFQKPRQGASFEMSGSTLHVSPH